MITMEYSVAGPAGISIAIVADLHEFGPKPVLSRLSEIRPDVIAVPGDLFENHEFGENLDKEDDSLISRLLCRIIHLANRLAGLRWRQKHRCSKQNAYDFLVEASKIAPVVMSLGNHELYLTEEDKVVLQDAKVTLLNNSTVEIKNVLFGGIPSKQITGKIDTEFLASFSELPGYKVLLCHHPEYYDKLRSYPINLILSVSVKACWLDACLATHGIIAFEAHFVWWLVRFVSFRGLGKGVPYSLFWQTFKIIENQCPSNSKQNPAFLQGQRLLFI